MVQYNLSHLTQPDHQNVSGPIQDDEALLLFAMIRVMQLKRVLEIGGLGGYSGRNFGEAVGNTGVVYTVDVNPLMPQFKNHRTIQKDCVEIKSADVDNVPLDLIFFDCHIFAAQTKMFDSLLEQGMVNTRTVIALHDTNLHPTKTVPWAREVDGGWVHQDCERQMVNAFRKRGYEAICFHTAIDVHSEQLPLRHGLTIMQIPVILTT